MEKITMTDPMFEGLQARSVPDYRSQLAATLKKHGKI